MAETTHEALIHHWALDEQAAEVLATRIDKRGLQDELALSYAGLSKRAIETRDTFRRRIGDIFTRKSDESLFAGGPCSLDLDTDYAPVFDYLEEVREENPGTVVAFRGNGAKPRTGTGYTGLFYGLDPARRRRLFEIYAEALDRGIPIITEPTEGNQLGALAPYLSAVWMGARDIKATGHRGKFSAYHIPAGVKNDDSGDLSVVRNTILTVRSNSADNDQSGVDLGTIASGPEADNVGIATGIVPVGSGNQEVAIFARGYELPADMPSEEKQRRAFEYISNSNLLGLELGSSVVIDGTHGVPPMFDIDRKYPDRFVPVIRKIVAGIKDGSIKHHEQMSGLMGEIGVDHGRTDPNLVLDAANRAQLSEVIKLMMTHL